MASLLLVGLSSSHAEHVRTRLRGSPWEVVHAPDLAEVNLSIHANPPEAVVADLRRRDATELIAAWRREGLQMPILVLAGPAGEHATAMRMGATDYLLEPFDAEDVVVRVETRLQPPIALPDMLRLVNRTVDLGRALVEGGERPAGLTATEQKLFEFLASRPGRTVTKATLLQQVWGYQPGVRSRTVITTMARLRAKIEANPAKPVHLIGVYGVGYRFDPVQRPAAPPTHEIASRFFGREQELGQLEAQLADTRLVTVVGPGGVGKTRLARELASRQEGAWFCDLSDARDLATCCRAIATGLGVPLGSRDPVDQLKDVLCRRTGALVIFDNLEQVSDIASGLLEGWIPAAPSVKFLATSRGPLGVTGEHLLPLDPLPIPPATGSGSSAEDPVAIQLFEDRARAANPAFTSADCREDIAQIVRALDGLPLAIELAAARVRVLPVAALSTQLADPLRVLAAPHRPGTSRQATLRATFEWSWDLLTDEEREVFAGCSVFSGGFTLDAAEEVLDRDWLLDTLHRLVDHSLLQSVDGRFVWLRTLHAFASSKLPEAERSRFETRHGAWFAGLGHEMMAELREHGGAALQGVLIAEVDNLLVAVDRALATEDAQTAGRCALALSLALNLTGPLRDVLDLVGRVETLSDLTPDIRGRLYEQRSIAARGVSGPQAMLEAADQAIACGSQTPLDIARQQTLRAHALLGLAQPDAARAQIDQAIAVLEADWTGAWETRWARVVRAAIDSELGQHDRAFEGFEQALREYSARGDRHGEAIALGNLANEEAYRGRHQDAVPHYREALQVHRLLGNTKGEVEVLGNLACSERELGRLDDSTRHFLQAIAAGERAGLSISVARCKGNLGSNRLWEGALDSALTLYCEAVTVYQAAGERREEGVFRGSIASVEGLKTNAPIAESRYLEVSAFFDRAEALLEPFAADHAKLAFSRADFCLRAGRVTEAREWIEQAEALSRPSDQPQLKSLILCLRGDVWRALGDLDAAETSITLGLQALREARGSSALAEALCRRARLERARGHTDAAQESVDEAVSIFNALGRPLGDAVVGRVSWLIQSLGSESVD